MKQKKQKWIVVGLLIVIIINGGVLRFWNIQNTRNVDEHNIIDNAVVVAEGKWHIRWYNWPAQSLIHIDGVVLAVAYQWAHRLNPEISSVQEWYIKNPQIIRAIAHGITVLFGVLAIFLAYILGRRLTASPWAGLLTAGLLAVNYLHSLHSRFATPDVPLATCYLGALLSCLYYLKAQTKKQRCAWALAAGAVIGITLATKYTGALVVAPIAVAVLWRNLKQTNWKKTVILDLLCLMSGLIIFHFIFNPFVLGDWQIVLKALHQEANPSRLGADWGGKSGAFWKNLWFYWQGSLAWNGTVISLIAYVTMIWSVIRWQKPFWKNFLLITVLYLVTLLGLSSLGLHWSRWSLPLTVLLELFASVGIWCIIKYFKKKIKQKVLLKIITAVFLAIIIFPQLLLSVVQAAVAQPPTTSVEVSNYLKSLSPNGASVAADAYFIEPGSNFKVSEPGIGLYDQTVAEYKKQKVNYLVVKATRLGDAKKQSDKYQNIITFFDDLKTTTTKLQRFSEQHGETILDHKKDFGVYRWLWQNRHNLSSIIEVRDGDIYTVYSL
ncbi:MAG: hypothetical protein A2233_02680 [Candidatus Kerfeldbacteria bacterium RIFOXYA2_FULL_38_24]|uniref:ArnT-like N-terminal domain-containing protein n=1 Tax=Candidatus Kerfeldbacteria bacterium RIFOXYB2_FULL_38_14 TaxID=1798547 RepID=A0A1G2BI19_9BACT|nr:MAG: hypothetical protein A2233_02680 [Candidatus Kerfeldbacteria bacterium RIFOXYA2_FULL_38_24]OGY88336.1 MAG: hypothetical protein A2319_03390 [Candidatus Kerfeldbacteria bacterium RIFOXYB2_FULL_38_14]